MKTSNKILLGIFIAVLLILTVIHFTLSSKYKAGDYTIKKNLAGKDSFALKPVKFVKLSGLDNVIVVPSYEFRLETEKNMPSYFKYHISGDTLVVTGDTAVASNGQPEVMEHRKVYQEVSIHVPSVKLIQAVNCTLGMTGKVDSVDVFPIRVELIGSRLSFKNHFHVRDTTQYFGDVYVTAKKESEIELFATTLNFKSFSCDLEASAFRDNQTGNIQRLNIVSDSSSTIQLSGANYQKIGTAPKMVDSLRAAASSKRQ